MFIAIIGTRFSGKSSIENYLVAAKGFKSVRLVQPNPEYDVSVFEEKFEVYTIIHHKELSNSLSYSGHGFANTAIPKLSRCLIWHRSQSD